MDDKIREECQHEAYQGRCAHCNAPYVNGRALPSAALPVVDEELVDDLAHDADFRDAIFKTDEAYFHLLAYIAVQKLRPYFHNPLPVDEEGGEISVVVGALPDLNDPVSDPWEDGRINEVVARAIQATLREWPYVNTAAAVAVKTLRPYLHNPLPVDEAKLHAVINQAFDDFESAPVTLENAGDDIYTTILKAIRPYLHNPLPVVDDGLLEKAKQLAAECIANLQPEGKRTKADEWEACYAGLFTQMMELIEAIRGRGTVDHGLIAELEALKMPEYNGSSYFDYGAKMVADFKKQVIALIRHHQPGKVSLEKCAMQLYCKTRRGGMAWPRVFSWGECKDKQPYYDDAKAVLDEVKKQTGVQYAED